MVLFHYYTKIAKLAKSTAYINASDDANIKNLKYSELTLMLVIQCIRYHTVI